MGWNAQDIEKLRKQNNGQKSTAGTGQSAAPKSTTAPARSSGSTGWSAEKIDALRTGSGTKPAAKSTDAWVNRSAGTSVRSTAQKAGTQSAGKRNQNPTSGSLSAQVLGQMTGTQSVQTTKKAGSRLPTVERTGQPEWLGTGKNSAPAAKVLGTGTKSGKTYAERNNAMPMQSASGAMASAPNAESVKKQIKDADAKRVESWYARDAQQLKQETEELKATDKFSDFDRLNQWMDADPQHRQLVRLLRTGKGNKTYAERNNAMQPISVSGAMASAPTAETSTEKREYTDAELLAKGYSRKQIREARQYIADFDALPDWQRAARRISNTIGGIVDTVASAPLMAGETAVRSVQNAAETGKNWNELQESVKSDDRQWKLLCLMTGGKTQYAGRDNAMQLNSSGVMAAPAQSTGMAYTDEELKAKGYSQSEIDRMRARISGAKVSEGIDPEKSLGYQMYKRGQQLNEAAQAGMSPIARQLMGVTTSAAENLAVAGISPALVLPVLSAQGGAESMGQSIEKGESAGKTLVGGLAKFGAGWAINSVGAADLARTMGSDYAKDTLAGKLADVVRSVADNGVLAQQYPTVANAVSGGIDNAMQAFVETYADKAIDAALGDAQAAEEMFSRDTFLQALESGLSGGASGALGGAVGTQLGRMSAALETADGQTVQRNEPSQPAKGADSSPEGRAFETERQAAANDRQVGNAAQKTEDAAVLQKETAPAASETVTEQTAVNDDPAVHTPAQNTSIEEYKQSVDPGLAEYVDRVRAGETPEPYMVTETSDRMRDAMQQLTGLDKVGSRTLMDANAVKHITNRHAGGDGSADGTMKESADVARAAYVLNHFDNAYLATRKADGYYTGSRKKAPIVIFEKKIDGSHIVVEAVCDTKKSKNFIVSEYLSSVGVPEKEIAKALQPSMDAVADPRDTSGTLSADTSAISEKAARALRSSVSAASDPELYVRNVAAANSATTESVQAPMDAASDPRDTSETLTAHSSADTTVSQRAGDVNGNRVENAGETVESAAVKELAKRWRVSDAAAESMSRNMPEGVGAEVYTPAAASLYRLGVNGEGESFAQALQMTGSGTLSGAVRQVLATGETGRLALEMAYTQGRGEAERYKETKAAELGRKPDAAALREDAGTLYNGDGTENGSRRAGDELIRLTAGANGLAAQRVTEGIKNRAKGLIQSGIGKVFYSGEADTATVLHETFHAANSWDSAGAQEMIDTFEHYLVKQNGMDSVMQLVESYLDRYEKAGQSLTYNQAMEEITADAMQSIFGSEESFRNYLRQQALEAQQNASALGKCQRVMEKIGTMLEKVLTDIKSLLVKEPTNAAARATQSLTEQQLKDLQQLWFNHQTDAGESYRAALEANGGANKNAAGSKAAAEGEKYNLPEMASETEEKKTKRQMALTIRPAQPNAERTAKVSGQNWSGQKTQDVYKAIRNILTEFGIRDKTFRLEDLDVEFGYGSANIKESTNKQKNVSEKEYNDFALVQANIEEVLANAVPLEAHADKKGTEHVEGMIVLASALQDGERIIPVRAELKLFDNRPTTLYFAIAETTAQESQNAANKKRTGSESRGDGVSTTDSVTTGSSEKELDLQVRQEPLLTQEAALPVSSERTGSEGYDAGIASNMETPTGSSDLSIFDYYRLVNHDANFTKYFSDEVAQKAESGMPGAAERLQARADAIEKDRNYIRDHGKYQLDVDSEDVEAAREAQMGSGRAASEAVQKVMEQAQNATVSDDSLLYIARKMVKASASRMDAKTLASRLAALRDYMNGGNVDWAQAHGFVLDMAQQIMEKSTKRNDALWKQYPELHQMEMSLEKGSKDYREVVYKYGSWAGATKELARHGVKLTLTKNGEVSRWDADFTELQGIGGGLLPTETPSSAADALEAMAAAHDAIRPTMESAYDSDWDAAKQELAMEIWGEYLGLPGVANESNAALRRKFGQQTKEMNEKARKHALALQAQVNLEEAKRRARNRQKMAKPYADATAKAKEHYAKTEEKLREKIGAKERKLEQQVAIQREAERGRAREKVAIAKAKNEQRLAQLRESRDKDNTRRAIRKVTGELTKLYEHPKEGSYIPDYLLDKVMPVLQLANEVTGNRETAERLAGWRHRGEDGWHYTPMQDTKTEMDAAVDGLRRGIQREMEAGDRANLEWEQSGLTDAIDSWLADVNDNRQREIARLEEAIRNAQKLGDEYGGIDGTMMEAHLNALQKELDGYKSGGMAALSAAELRGLRDILEQTAHIIKIDNVVVGAQEDARIDDFAKGAKSELEAAKGVSKKTGLLGKMSRRMNSYRMNTMNIERMFERMGGYAHGGYLENLGKMLNDGQRKKTKIQIECDRIFDNVTGKAHEKELYHYTHDLVDIGFRDESGRARKVNHDQLAELWLQLQNPQGLHHILHGGITLDNMEAKVKGDNELAQLDRETVRVGELNLRDAEGKLIDLRDIEMDETAVRRSLLDEIEKNLTDYDRAWIEDYRKMNAKTSGYINETSLLLSGVRKATTENYIHINVDQDANPEQNKGIRYDNSVGNPGWLNHRVNSSKPVLLVGLVQQVNTSIENTAQYAGMAIPLRNAEKILNSMPGGKTLFKQVEHTWGKAGREYLNKALADLCGVKDSREVGDGAFARMRSFAAQAVLNANVNVTLLQAASLPTAAAELGWGSTGRAAVQFGANLLDPIARFFGSEGALAKIEARMAEHGDELLQYRLRGTGTAELGSAGAQKGFFGRMHDAARNSDNAAVSGATHAADKVVSLWTGGITKADEITVAALWAGSESYVKSHPEEFAAGAEVTDSPAYWAAVNEKFERVVERTQPNYTAMQRTGYQRTKNEMAKFLMMFSTQRQQNAQIWTASVEDMLAQYERYGKSDNAEAKAEIKKANERFLNAATSQVAQTALIAVLGIGVKFLLHRWDDLQDENGDMTRKSILDALTYDFFKSFVGNWTGGSEVMSAGEMILNRSFTSYDTISMTGISAINDLTECIGKVYQLNAKDTSGMTEEQLETHKQKTVQAVADMLGQLGMLRGVPYTNLKKQVQAVTGWMDTAANWSRDGGNFNSLPESATGQYDRLYNAYVSGDPDEAQAAVKKLDQMVQAGAIAENKMYDQLKTRLKKYDADTRAAAKAQMEGNEAERYRLETETIEALYDVLGIRKNVKEDAPKREAVIDCVTGAVNARETELLAGDSGDVYADLKEAADSWNARDVQKEYDRLVKAGRSGGTVKKKITEAVKPEYLAGSDADKQRMADMLLALTDADGKALYTEKTFTQWEEAAEKAAQEQPEEDPYALLR
jgi:hypothetical protein